MSNRANCSNKFLGNKFVSSFACNNNQPCKKPKLDVTLSQSSSSANAKKTEVPGKISLDVVKKDYTKVNSIDHFLGDDFDNALNQQCDLIESQALSQDITIEKNMPIQTSSAIPGSVRMHQTSNATAESIKIHQTVIASPGTSQLQDVTNFNGSKGNPSCSILRTPKRSGTLLLRAASAGNLPDTPISLSISNGNGTEKYNVEGAKLHLQSQANKFREECKILREQLQSKEGEVKYLRNILQSNKTEFRKKSNLLTEQLAKAKEENSKKIIGLEKDINDLKTMLEFKGMELKSLEEKLQKSREIVASDSARSNKRKNSDINRTLHFDERQTKESDYERSHLGIGKMTISVNEGSLLAKLVEPETYKPLHSNGSDFKYSPCDKDINEVKRDTSDSLIDYYCLLTRLYKYESFSTYSARSSIEKVLKQCFKACCQLLRIIKSEGIQGKEQRNKELLERSHTILPVTENYSNLSSGRLYPEEKGIEVRRILGLNEILVKISCEAAKIFLNSDFEIKSNGTNILILHDSEDWNITSINLNNENVESERNYNNMIVNIENKRNSEKREIIESNEVEDTRISKMSLLHILRDITLVISSERRSLNYNGLLVAISLLLSSLLERNIMLEVERQHLILDIIRYILTSCPGPTVILNICRLLKAAGCYPFIVNGLCTDSVNEEEEFSQFYSFKKDTCPISALCCVVQAMGQNKSYMITDVMTHWLLCLLTKDENKFLPVWLCSSESKNRLEIEQNCSCPFNLSKVITTLLCEAAFVYDTERTKLDEEKRLAYERILERGTLLLYRMVQHNSFKCHLLGLEVQYELLMHTLGMLGPEILHHSFSKKLLEGIIHQENLKEPVGKKDINEDEELNNSIFAI